MSVIAEVTGCLTFSRDLPQGGQKVPVVLEFHSEEDQLLRWCKELVTENLSGLCRNHVIANKPLLVDCTEDSDSGEEYELETNDGGTARLNSVTNNINVGCNLSIDRNVVNEVSDSAPVLGEEHKNHHN